MSKIKEIIEITPPSGMYWESTRKEIFKSKIQECNVCNGLGGTYYDASCGRGEGYEVCEMCKGTGEIQCNINTEWITVGKVKEQFKTIEQ